MINKNGISIYIKYSDRFLYNRLIQAKKVRPLLQNKSKEEMLEFITNSLEKREKFYQKAHYTIEKINLQVKDLLKFTKKYS